MADIMVIARESCETSQGTLAIGEMVRLPLVEALQLTHANKVTLASWQDQQLPEPASVRRHYRRRDLQAEES